MSIIVKDEYAKGYMDYLSGILRAKLNDRAELDKEIESLREQIGEINKVVLNKESAPVSTQLSVAPVLDGYSKDWPWVQKIEFLLDVQKKDLTVSQLSDELILIQPELERKKVQGSMSATMSTNASKPNTIFTTSKNERGEFIYGLKKWHVTA